MNTPILRSSSFQNAVKRVIVPETEGGRALKENSGFVTDCHPDFELLFHLKGSCEYPLAGKLFSLTPGMVLLIPPWTTHAYGYRPCDTGLLHLWIHLRSTCYGIGLRVRNGVVNNCPGSFFDVSPELASLFLARWDFWRKTGAPGRETLYFKNILNAFLDELILYEKRSSLPERDIVKETLLLIRNANGRGCTLEFLAKQVSCSQYHLAHRVRETTGRTIGNFINESRIQYVHSALEHGLKQKEIAWNLGFSSAASFWNWYHRKMRDER